MKEIDEICVKEFGHTKPKRKRERKISMLMSFENYMNEEMDLIKNLNSSEAYPSVFELICLLPISKRTAFLEEALFSLDDCII